MVTEKTWLPALWPSLVLFKLHFICLSAVASRPQVPADIFINSTDLAISETTTNLTSNDMDDPAENLPPPDDAVRRYLRRMKGTPIDLCEVRYYSDSPVEPPESFNVGDYTAKDIEFLNLTDNQGYIAERTGGSAGGSGPMAQWQTHINDDWEVPSTTWRWSFGDRLRSAEVAIDRLEEYQRETLDYLKPPNKIVLLRWDKHYSWAQTGGYVYYEFYYAEFGFLEPKIILNWLGIFYADSSAFPRAVSGVNGSHRLLPNATAPDSLS